MDIETYYEKVGELAEATIASETDAARFLSSPGIFADLVEAAVIFREQALANEEEVKCQAYVSLGFLRQYSGRRRLAAWALSFDVQHEADLKRMQRLCEAYASHQPLFQGSPGLQKHIRQKEGGEPDNELIDARVVKRQLASRICRVSSGFAVLSSYLNPGVLDWAAVAYPNCPAYLRLDPYEFHEAEPLDTLEEAVVSPSNPYWVSKFEIFPGCKEYAEYVLEPCDAREDHEQFNEYQSKGIRRLEVHAQRSKANYLSMMIEELPTPDADNGLMISRMIHLDTLDPIHTPISEVRLQHLDLAVNVYHAADRGIRFGHRLRQGKVLDASFRTHLFRIEGVPFLSVFEFCEMFFNSKLLFTEWREDVFPSE